MMAEHFSVSPKDFPGNEHIAAQLIAEIRRDYEDNAAIARMRYLRGVLLKKAHVLTRERIDAYLFKGT